MVKMYSLLIFFGDSVEPTSLGATIAARSTSPAAKAFRAANTRLTDWCDGVSTMSTAVALLLLLVPLSGHGNDLVVQQLDGSGRVSLTGGVGFASAPAWSPDGSTVAFVSKGDTAGQGANHVWLVASDGSGLRLLTPGLPAEDPVWSPDGTQVAFLSGTSDALDVWTVPATGGTPRRLTTEADRKGGLAWSPRGSSLLYSVVAGGMAALFSLDPVTGGRKPLAAVGFFNDASAVWSPDGAKIAFVDPTARLALMNADGSGAHLLDPQQLASPPSWSPDGSALAFAARRNLPGPGTRFGPSVDTDVWTVDVATIRAHRLTGAFDADTQTTESTTPSWWPDGSRLFFHRDIFPGTRIWEMNADGTCEQPVAAAALGPGPLWQPGRSLAAGAAACADLRLRVVSDATPVALGAFSRATVLVENDGNLPATDVHARITSTAGVQVELTPCGRPDCALGTIGPGSSRSFVAVVGGLYKPATLSAAIEVSAAEPDPTPSDAAGLAIAQVANCTIAGTFGADVLIGTRGRDRICGLPGADRLDGGKGDDYLDAGNGNDTIVGGPGRDTIIGRGGSDVILARDGRLDWIDCGTESDLAIVDRIDHTHHCEKVLRG
jgi:Tol biopolymer transport system component